MHSDSTALLYLPANLKCFPAYMGSSPETSKVGFYSIYNPTAPFLILSMLCKLLLYDGLCIGTKEDHFISPHSKAPFKNL
jgi:hypothetical protein